MRVFPPILDVFNHEAMPDWRTSAFWCSTEKRTALPGLIVGVVFSLYILIAAELIGLGLIGVSPAGSWLHGVGAFLADDVVRPHQFIFDLFAYALCIVIGENVVRVSLDIAANKPFRRPNAERFTRAAVAGAALIVMMIVVRVAEKSFGGFDFSVAGAGILAAAIAAASFASLAGAFRQGARLQEEQDLTV